MTTPVEELRPCPVCNQSIEGVAEDRLADITHDAWACERNAQMHVDCFHGLAHVNHSRACHCGKSIDPPPAEQLASHSDSDEHSDEAEPLVDETAYATTYEDSGFCFVCERSAVADDDSVTEVPHADGTQCSQLIHVACWVGLSDSDPALCTCGRDVVRSAVQLGDVAAPSVELCPICHTEIDEDDPDASVEAMHSGHRCKYRVHVACWADPDDLKSGVTCWCGRSLADSAVEVERVVPSDGEATPDGTSGDDAPEPCAFCNKPLAVASSQHTEGGSSQRDTVLRVIHHDGSTCHLKLHGACAAYAAMTESDAARGSRKEQRFAPRQAPHCPCHQGGERGLRKVIVGGKPI
ncbi:MAG TPA: hypothetical protein VLK34_02660 [Nocardioidaceae bacterium]|nr:hypothetical protein [Nocardioidaceae bacterium]